MRAEIVGIQYSPVPENFDRRKKPRGGFPVIQLNSAELVAGKGIRSLEGVEDRYFGEYNVELNGAYPNDKIRQFAIITVDAIDRAAVKARQNGIAPFTFKETRRNGLIYGWTAEELNDHLYKEFTYGGAVVYGDNLCDPCERPGNILVPKRKGFKEFFTSEDGQSIGGLRVKILNSGLISVGK